MWNFIRKYLLFGWIEDRRLKNVEKAKQLRSDTRSMNNNLGDMLNRNRGGNSSIGGPTGGLPPHIKNLFDMLGSQGGPSRGGNPMEGFEKDLGDLGEPDEIETFSDGDITWEKHTWHTPTGSIGRVEIKGDIDGEIPPDILSKIMSGGSRKKKKTLEERLQDAVEAEDYKKAAELRDEIANKGSEVEEKEEKPERKNPPKSNDNWDF